MLFPNLPTDNLYKFLALSGLFLLSGGMWIVWTMEEGLLRDEASASAQYGSFVGDFEAEIRRVAAHISGKEREITVEIGIMHDDGFNRVKPGSGYRVLVEGEDRKKHRAALAYWDDVLANYLPSDISNENSEKKTSIEDQTKPRFDYDTIRGLRVRLREYAQAVEILWVRVDSMKSFKRITYCIVFLGCVMSALGFYFWYTVIQIPQDLLIQLQLKRETLSPKSIGESPRESSRSLDAKLDCDPAKESNVK